MRAPRSVDRIFAYPYQMQSFCFGDIRISEICLLNFCLYFAIQVKSALKGFPLPRLNCSPSLWFPTKQSSRLLHYVVAHKLCYSKRDRIRQEDDLRDWGGGRRRMQLTGFCQGCHNDSSFKCSEATQVNGSCFTYSSLPYCLKKVPIDSTQT